MKVKHLLDRRRLLKKVYTSGSISAALHTLEVEELQAHQKIERLSLVQFAVLVCNANPATFELIAPHCHAGTTSGGVGPQKSIIFTYSNFLTRRRP